MSDALSYVYAVGRDLADGDLADLAGAGVGEGIRASSSRAGCRPW